MSAPGPVCIRMDCALPRPCYKVHASSEGRASIQGEQPCRELASSSCKGQAWASRMQGKLVAGLASTPLGQAASWGLDLGGSMSQGGGTWGNSSSADACRSGSLSGEQESEEG